MASFVKGTIFLTFVIFLSKLFGFVYRIQFMRIAGEEAVGIYMTAYPAFIFFISLVQIGLPIGVAKMIAELSAKRKLQQLHHVMKTASICSVISIILFVPFLYFFIPFLANTLLHNQSTKLTLYIALGAVPIVVFSGLLRGYLQGIASISPTAWSQMIEQLVRIGLITYLLPFIATNQSSSLIAAYAMGITTIGELLAFLYLYITYKLKKKKVKTSSREINVLKPLLKISVPSAGSKLFGTFTWFLEPIVFLKALTLAGFTAVGATTLYGIISGVHIPLLLFPSFISNALAVVLIPAVSDAIARNNYKLINERIGLSLRLCSIVGALSAAFFFLHGDELAVRLFHLEEDRGFMKVLAPIFYFYYIQSPLHSILQAVDEARSAMMNSIYGGIGKLFVMFVLASQEAIAESGAIIAIGFGVLVTSFLHIATLRSHPMIAAGFRFFVVPYLIFIVTVILQSFIVPSFDFWIEGSITVTLCIGLLVLSGQLKASDFSFLRSFVRRF